MSDLKETTLRDFGGGWNVSDSDKSLSPRYQPVSDNVNRGTDGNFSVRYGTKLYWDMKQGVETVYTAEEVVITTVNSNGRIEIELTAHGFTDGDHITITSIDGTITGQLATNFEGHTFGVSVIDADNFAIYTRQVSTAADDSTVDMTFTHDTHLLGGEDIFGRYFNNSIIVFSNTGEIVRLLVDGVVEQVWNYTIADGLTLEPWGECSHVSAEIIKGRLIAVNGRLNDKPIAIEDDGTVNYLVDASTLSNGAIPRADFVIAVDQYVILVSTEYGTTMLEIGAKNTVMTCSREVDPGDAIEYDVGMMTQSAESAILGASVIRSKVFLGFADRTMLGIVGIYNTVGAVELHEPDFNDNMAEFGTFSHRSIVSLGNDLFCVGVNGVNSLELSRGSDQFVPTTVSDFIHPVLLRHLMRLSEEDRRTKVFSIFDNTARSYIMYVPKYSEEEFELLPDAVTITTTLQPYNLALLTIRKHVFDDGDYIDIAGIEDFNEYITGDLFNGRRRIRRVIDEDTLLIEVDEYPANNRAFGGDNITVNTVNDETIGYIYEYNSRLKIRRWTRYRGLQFRWGVRSQFNSMFYGWQGRVYRFGEVAAPYSADKIGDYTHRVYENSFDYEVGDRVLDSENGKVYECIVAHTSHDVNDFEFERGLHEDDWVEFLGFPITWELETPWTDFNKRKLNKQVEFVSFDTRGTAEFDFSIFTNSIRYDLVTAELSPVRTTRFIGEDRPGFGAGDQPWGGGRNTKQEWLHSMPSEGKLFRFRFSGSSIYPLRVNAVTLYYHLSKALT